MAETDTPSHETSEEVLATEINELEKRTLNSAWLWVAAAMGLIVLFSVTFFITNWDRTRSNARRSAVAPEAMVLREPLGTVDRDFTFRWNRVPGARTYILLVRAHDRDEVELLRPVDDPYLKPSESEISNFNPGSYVWTVEARSASEQLIGYGEGKFEISTGD
jgi:hypothetical protein